MPSSPKAHNYTETEKVTRKTVNPAETMPVEKRVEWALLHLRSLKSKSEELAREIDLATRMLLAEPCEVVEFVGDGEGWADSKDDWRNKFARINTSEIDNCSNH